MIMTILVERPSQTIPDPHDGGIIGSGDVLMLRRIDEIVGDVRHAGSRDGWRVGG